MATKVLMPQLGESVVEGKVSRWLKQEGDAVKQYEPILEVETDKVTTEITAAAGGVGLLLVQLARACGARVIGLVGSEAKAALALAKVGSANQALAASIASLGRLSSGYAFSQIWIQDSAEAIAR